jgi:hypothetical protein
LNVKAPPRASIYVWSKAFLDRAGWAAVIAAADQMKAGSFDGLARAGPRKCLNNVCRTFDA